MGTRNLTMVINEKGETKVAQYGQWDGYPGGVGSSLLAFLKDDSLVRKLKDNLEKCRFLDDEKDKDFLESYNSSAPKWSKPDNRSPEQKEWWSEFMSRDLADDVLKNIAYSDQEEILLADKSNVAKDSLFCEWAYVVDFSKGVLECYSGFQKQSKDGRFGSELKDGYYPVALLKTYLLSDLPDEGTFCLELEPAEEED